MLIKVLTIIISNAIAVYGIVFLHWNFFMILYAYWFGELIATGFEKISLTIIRKRGELPIETNSPQNDVRFFFLAIYWVFIVAIAGFIAAPEKEYIENIRVLIFSNSSFNLNLLIFFIGELLTFYAAFYLNKNYNPIEIVNKYRNLSKRTYVMHISIIFGTFSWFAMNTDKFFFKIDVGEYGVYGFMIVFSIVRIIGDLMGLKQSSKE